MTYVRTSGPRPPAEPLILHREGVLLTVIC